MARVNVESRAFSETRLFKLMKLMNWSRAQTLGALLILWHDSQEQMKEKAEKEEILQWLDTEEPERFFEALIESKYLVKNCTGFHICGNAPQVNFLQRQRELGRKGGLASGRTRSKAPNLDQLELTSISEAPEATNIENVEDSLSSKPSLSHTEAMQCNAKQLYASAYRSVAPSSKAARDKNYDAYSYLSEETKQRLFLLYPEQEFIRKEGLLMQNWLEANWVKSPRSASGWSRFVGGWLKRSWESYRRNIQSRPTQTRQLQWD